MNTHFHPSMNAEAPLSYFGEGSELTTHTCRRCMSATSSIQCSPASTVWGFVDV